MSGMKLRRGYFVGRNFLYSVMTRHASTGPVWLTRADLLATSLVSQ